MRAGALGLALACAALAGCGGGAAVPRGDVIRHALESTLQLASERDGGARRAASGVVLAADAAASRTWVLTAGHFLGAAGPQRITVTTASRSRRGTATVVASSQDPDLAVLVVDGLALPAVALKTDASSLGDDVWVIAFPWGRRFTVVSGVVSQVTSPEGEGGVEGPVRMVDASVSYGASGGGVFDTRTGGLVGIVEGYRTARVSMPKDPGATLEVPVPGETRVVSSRAILKFLEGAGLSGLLAPRPQ